MESKNIQLSKTVLKANTGADAIKKAPIVEFDTGIKCLRIGDVSQGRGYEDWGFSKVEDRFFENFKLVKDDILIARTGNTIGVNLIVKSNNIKSVFNNGLIRLKIDTENYNPTYIYYIISSNEFQSYIQSIAFGTSTQPNMKIDDLLKYKIKYLEKKFQDKIADILSAFDDKIELNNQINQTLEDMATALFKEWFENFNFQNEQGKPYKDNDGEMKSSELGEIPIDWEVSDLEDLIYFNPRTTLKKGTVTKYVDMKSLSINSMSIQGFIDREFTGSGTKFVNKDTLLSRITPCLENGKIGFVNFLEENEIAWGSTEYIICRGKEEFLSEFTYLFTRYEPFYNYAISNMNGSSGRQRVPADILKRFKFAKSQDENIYKQFSNIVNPIFEQIQQNQQQNQILKEQRDTLLPKLMSGEIRV